VLLFKPSLRRPHGAGSDATPLPLLLKSPLHALSGSKPSGLALLNIQAPLFAALWHAHSTPPHVAPAPSIASGVASAEPLLMLLRSSRKGH
jgi:hypothetical protein